jgi:hypothetical protein
LSKSGRQDRPCLTSTILKTPCPCLSKHLDLRANLKDQCGGVDGEQTGTRPDLHHPYRRQRARRRNGVFRSSHLPSHPGSNRRSRTTVTTCKRNSSRVSCGRRRCLISVECDPMRTSLHLLQRHRSFFFVPVNRQVHNFDFNRPFLRHRLRRVDLQYPCWLQYLGAILPRLPHPTWVVVLLGQHHENI